MKTKIFSILTLLVIFSSHFIPQVINTKTEDKIKIFDAWIESKIEFEHWPGIVIGIVHDQI